ESLRKMRLSRSAPPIRLWRTMRAALLRRVSHFVVISAEIREALVAVGVHDSRIRFIPNGIDVDRFQPLAPDQKPALRRKLGLPEDPALLNFTGRLSAAKGLMMLLRIWKGLVAEGRSVHLLLVGTGGIPSANGEPGLRPSAKETASGRR